jgi:hypothetical protein
MPLTKPLGIDACLAAATHSATPPASRPSVEQLREQLGIAKESLARLLETHMRENEDREDWAEDMRKSGVSLGHQAFDLTVKAVLGHYAADAKLESDWAFLYSNKETYEGAKDAEERFKSAAEAADKIATLRDSDQVYRDYNDPKKLPGDIVPALDAAKLTVKTLLARQDVQNTLERWAQYGVKASETVPFVDRTVTIGGGLIDAGYDLTVEYLGFQQIQQADRNSELFYRGAATEEDSNHSGSVEVFSIVGTEEGFASATGALPFLTYCPPQCHVCFSFFLRPTDSTRHMHKDQDSPISSSGADFWPGIVSG